MKKLVPVLWLVLVVSAVLPLSGQDNYQLKKTIGLPIYFPGSIAIDKEGNMYMAQEAVVLKLNAQGELIDHFSPAYTPTAIAVDAQGNIYVVDSWNHRIQKFDASSKFLMEFGSYGSGDGQFITPTAIAVDAQGNIYVVDSRNHRIQKFDVSGKFLMKFGSEGSGDGQFYTPKNIAVDAQGNIYVVEDFYNNRIQKFDASGKFLMKFGSYGSTDIAVDAQGNIYVVDFRNDRIQKFDASGKFLMKFGSKGSGDGQLNTPTAIAVDAQGNIYVVDSWNHRIQKFDASGKFLMKFGSYGFGDRQFGTPDDIALDLQGNIYVAENDATYNDIINQTYTSFIRKFDASGKFLMRFGSYGSGDGQFNNLGGVTVDTQGNIYVADSKNYRIQKFDTSGKFLMKFGSYGSGDGQFYTPKDIAVDAQGNIYVVEDFYNDRIQKFDASGKFLMKFGSYGFGDGQFNSPSDIAVDTQGNIYVVDSKNYRIQKFDASGKFLMKFGSYGFGDGQFYTPKDIAVDAQGNIYVVDSKNNRIQKFDASGKFVAKIGEGLPYTSIALDRYNSLYATAHYSVLIYKTSRSWSTISGHIFSDENQNCTQDVSEKPLSNVVVVAQPGNYYGLSDQTGKYTLTVDTGTYTVSQFIQNSSTRLMEPICPSSNISSSVVLKVKGDSVTNINFANKATLLPHLSSNVTSNRRRRCFLSATTVNYANTGYADAQNVSVYVKVPRYVALKSADKPYVLDKDSNYVFTIGTLKAGESGTIQIKDSVVCQRGITGLTVCTKAWITPANGVTPKGSWDQSDITLTGRCIENGRVRFVLTNSGQGSMADSSEFRLFMDAKLALRKNFKIAQGDSLVLRIPANGRTVRLEANQRPDHPRKSQSTLTLEGCVASASEVVSKGLVDVLPQDDAEPEVSVDCQRIIDSYDPNDKQVSPIGTTDQRFTPTTASLKYLIRFQNTGSDTAYTVVLVDTLSEHLDMATLEVQGSSHPYKLGVSGKGRPVLTFTFNNINLPDSTRNQLGSNGFIQFSIKPLAGLAEKTLIENFADIYFDYNDPIRTNTTTNRIYDVPPVVEPTDALPVNEVVLRKPQIATLGVALVEGKTTITIDGSYFEKVAEKNIVSINGIAATVIEASEGKLVVTIPTPKDPISGKVTVRTDGGEGVSELELVLASEAEVALPGVRLYPNPSSGLVTVDFSQSQERISKVVVYNAVGKQVLVVVPQRKTQLVSELNLTPYGAGMYLISIQAGEKQLTRKVVIR